MTDKTRKLPLHGSTDTEYPYMTGKITPENFSAFADLTGITPSCLVDDLTEQHDREPLTFDDLMALRDEIMELGVALSDSQAWEELAKAKKEFDRKRQVEQCEHDRDLLREFNIWLAAPDEAENLDSYINCFLAQRTPPPDSGQVDKADTRDSGSTVTDTDHKTLYGLMPPRGGGK